MIVTKNKNKHTVLKEKMKVYVMYISNEYSQMSGISIFSGDTNVMKRKIIYTVETKQITISRKRLRN